MIKFVCKDLFLYVYGKQIDNLRTNHRGVFVLQSHAFPPLESLSSYRGAAADLEAARHHLVFPQALIQGALARLGMHTTVTCESSQLPQCELRSYRMTCATVGSPQARSRSERSRTHPVARTARALRASSGPCLHPHARLLYRCHIIFYPHQREDASVCAANVVCPDKLEAFLVLISDASPSPRTSAALAPARTGIHVHRYRTLE